VPVNFVTAALGGEIEVPTLTGNIKLKIPEGAQTGKVFKIKGKGVANVKGHGIGDEKVRVVVETPTNLTKKQRELLEEFAKESSENDPMGKSFWEKMKDFMNTSK